MSSIIKSPKLSKENRVLKVSYTEGLNNSASEEKVMPIAVEEHKHEVSIHEIQEELRLANEERDNYKSELDLLSGECFALKEKIKDLQSSLSISHDEASKVGYDQGYKSGVEEANAKAVTQLEILKSIIEDIRQQREKYVYDAETIIVESIFASLVKIIGESDRDVIRTKAIMNQVKSQIFQKDKLFIRVSQKDYAIFCENEFDKYIQQHVQFVIDNRVLHGGCIIESNLGNLDARLDVQLQRFKDLMLDVYVEHSDSTE